MPTVEYATELLRSCKDDVQKVLAGKPLQVRFNGIASFQSNPRQCHVLFGTPVDAEERGSEGRLKAVCGWFF